ncbi:hypothetical protein WKR88_19750 [Trinickia caryophylli]|uniref:hypothetical protein n=1 Tax=Trinickia caryophylli TaxID=28094 RepID=UPI0013048A51|nr:hypothetical protein [Trinickia caryophylli]WQE12467.1 hypothetical protein U0034_03310 [Trinickia caryophylli]GLU31382.1 hypothetical protein Busp01_12240 [Trinickia caryophylli]
MFPVSASEQVYGSVREGDLAGHQKRQELGFPRRVANIDIDASASLHFATQVHGAQQPRGDAVPKAAAIRIEEQARMVPKPRTGNRDRIHDVPGRFRRINECQVGTCCRELFPHVMEAVEHLEPAFTPAPDAYDDEPPASRDFQQGRGSPIGQQQHPIQIEHVDYLRRSARNSGENAANETL